MCLSRLDPTTEVPRNAACRRASNSVVSATLLQVDSHWLRRHWSRRRLLCGLMGFHWRWTGLMP